MCSKGGVMDQNKFDSKNFSTVKVVVKGMNAEHRILFWKKRGSTLACPNVIACLVFCHREEKLDFQPSSHLEFQFVPRQ